MKAFEGTGFSIALLACILLAASLRLPGLDERPMHTDEAIHAYKTEQLSHGRYEYDPRDFHGPTPYYAARIGLALGGVADWRGATESDYRVIPALFGIGAVALCGAFASGFGRVACFVAALLLAASPFMTFYSRYYIQEMLLVFFTGAFLALAYRCVRRPHLGVALAAGAAAGLMYATKETAAFAVVAMLAAWFVTWRWRCRCAASAPATTVGTTTRTPPRPVRRVIGHAVAALIAGVFVAGHLLSGFGTRSVGLAASFDAFGLQGRAGLHDHPWYEYLSMLAWSRFADGPVWTEAAILLLGIVGAVVALRGRAGVGDRWFQRFAALYALILTAIYSVVSHKTPWSFASAWFAWTLLAGFGAAALMTLATHRAARGIVAALVLASVVHLVVQAQRGVSRFAADARNPWVYAHTSPDLVRLAERVRELAALGPDGARTRIDVIVEGDDYWPLPWYLRHLDPSVIGYWRDVPDDVPAAPIVIASTALREAVEARAGEARHVSVFGLRPAVLLDLHVARPLWEAFLRARTTTTRASHRAPAARTARRSFHHRAMATAFSVRFPEHPTRGDGSPDRKSVV